MGQKKKLDPEGWAKIKGDYLQDLRSKNKGYRAQALKLFAHVCGSCGREFSGKRLRELTVHHKDHNHDYNPPDGSNWELLCLFCHDHEHEKFRMKGYSDGAGTGGASDTTSTFQPFAGLDDLIKSKSDESETD